MAASYRLRIVPGETFRRRVVWRAAGVPVDLAGFTAIFEATHFDGTDALTLTADAGLTLGGADGTIDLYAPHTATAALSGSGKYHLHVVEPNGDHKALLCGVADYASCAAGATDDGDIVVDSRDQITIMTAGRQGPAGNPGPVAIIEPHTAGEALGGHRVVVLRGGLVWHADPFSAADAGLVVGVTTGAASALALAQVQTHGILTEPSWAWTPDQPLYLAAAGTLAHTPPDGAAWVQALGFAAAADTLYINLDTPFLIQ